MKRILSLLIAVSAVIGATTFCSCEKNKEESILVIDGETANYAIYREEKASDLDKSAATNLRNRIKEATGVMITYRTDHAADKVEELSELLVGNTNRKESAEAAGTLGENQTRIVVIGETVCIVGSNGYCLDAGVDKFCELYVSENGVSLPKTTDRTWNCVADYDGYTVTNPINDGGNDPDVVEHNGVYYYCWSSGGIKISSASSIDKISKDNGKQVYSPPTGTMWSKEYWAPELHYIQGEWYVYVAADDGEDANHRMYVLKGKSQDPLDGFEMVGKIFDPTDKWAIDGTVITINNELYFVWSGWEGNNDPGFQKLYIAHMSSPTEIDTKRVMISKPTNSWEGSLNEGPYPVYHDGDIFIFFSANGSWGDDYCVSYLKLKEGQDPLKMASWEKASAPIMSKSANSYGPGHCSVAQAIDGSYWMIYHANLVSGTGWSGRSVWIQQLEFNDKGYPKQMKSKTTVTYPTASWRAEEEV